MARTRAYLAALAFLGWAGFAHALGLGEIEVRSHLNQPINALIPISSSAGEAEDLVVQLASNDDFDRAGMERSEFLSTLRFEVVGGAIKVTSKTIAREPFVSFLLDARWSGGRLLREYTLLLDPPQLAQQQRQQAAAQKPPAEVTPAPAAGTTPGPMETAPAEGSAPVEAAAPAGQDAAPTAPAPTATYAGESYGPISPKETLWSIAYKLRPDPATITMDQMQVAIFNANPQAFHGGRINGLMKGVTLRIPSLDEIRAVDPASSKAMVAEARGAPPPAAYTPPAVATTPPPAETTPPPQVAEVTPPPPAETTPPPPAEVTPPPAETTPPPAETAQAPPTETVPPPPAETTPPPAASSTPPPTETTAPPPAAATTPPAPEEPGMVAGLLDQARSLSEQPWFYPAVAGFVVLILLLVGGRKIADKVAKWRYERASRKSQVAPVAGAAAGSEDVTQIADEPQSMEAALQEASAGADATVTMQQASSPAVEHTQAMVEATQAQTMQQAPVQATQALEPALATSGKVDFDVTGAFASETVQINLDAGDPVSEAEFHRAYGLYDEAALLLKQALQKDPKRIDAKVKLAEIYFEASKANEFVEVAKELKTQLPEAEWQKIALLGTQIAPDHELFKGGSAVSSTGTVDLSFDEPAAPAPAPAAAAPAPAPAADAGLDFKLEDVQLPDAPAAPAASAAPAEPGLEFDLGSLTIDQPAPAPAEAAPVSAPAAEASPDSTLSLGDFDLGAPEAPAAGGEVVEMATEVGMEAPVGAGDESSTKLDLARAYIDMGDSDMAKSLLNEVAQQGNAEQQKEAQELLKRVSG